MSSPRHTTRYAPVKIDNKTVLELKVERIAKLREKVLAGNYDDLKSQLPDLNLDILQTRFARHENGVLETTLLAAIEYCGERKRKNANEKAVLELQERDLEAEVKSIKSGMEAAKNETKALESKMEDCTKSMGELYFERKRKMIAELADMAGDPNRTGKPTSIVALQEQDKEKIIEAIMNSLDSTEIIQGDGFMAISVGGTEAQRLIGGLALPGLLEGMGNAGAPANKLESDDDYSRKAERKFAEMIREALEIISEESAVMTKYFPDVQARRIIRKTGGDCAWLEGLDIDAASRADPAVIKNAAKALRTTRMDLIETCKILTSGLKALYGQRNETEYNCNYLKKALDAQRVNPGMEESAKKHIENMRNLLPEMRKAITNLEKLQRIKQEMADVAHTYRKALLEYPEACRKLIACRKRAEDSLKHMEIIDKHGKFVDEIRDKDRRMSELAALHLQLKDEYAQLEKKRGKTALHAQNSLRKDMRKKEEEKPAFVFVKRDVLVECEAQKRARALDMMVAKALERYPIFKKRYSEQREIFEETIRELGRIYLENGKINYLKQHTIGQTDIINAFGKRAEHEPNRTTQDGAYKLVRIGFGDQYRILVDVAGETAILFAGKHDKYDKFLDSRAYTRAKRLELFDGLKNL